MMDLIQEGNIGLLEATKRFDKPGGCKFSTYACRLVKTFILCAMDIWHRNGKFEKPEIPLETVKIIKSYSSVALDPEEIVVRRETADEILACLEQIW